MSFQSKTHYTWRKEPKKNKKKKNKKSEIDNLYLE